MADTSHARYSKSQMLHRHFKLPCVKDLQTSSAADIQHVCLHIEAYLKCNMWDMVS